MSGKQAAVGAALVALLWSAAIGSAQEVGVSLIESTGIGTVHAPPSHVEFWVHRELEGTTLEEAVGKAEQLETELRTAMEAAELPRATLEVTAPTVSDLDKRWAVSSARVRFGIARHAEAAKTALEFGALCDKMVKAAATVSATLRGPYLDTEGRDVLLKQAVALATENAYPAAEAAAEALKSNFYSVDSVRIDSVTWNRTPESEAPEPNLGRVSCTVEVRVIYAVTPK